MAAVPGSVGLPLISDKSYAFYKDPAKFVEQNFKHYKSRIFCCRFLNTPTIFVGSNAIAHEVLGEKAQYMQLGYKSFLEGIYGDNILFTEGDVAKSLRQALTITMEQIDCYEDVTRRAVSRTVEGLVTDKPIGIYRLFKRIATEICLTLFLGLDFVEASDIAETIIALTTEHWHGIISIPVSFKLPMMSSSTYKKALEAKAKLLQIIIQRSSDKKLSFYEKLQLSLSSEQMSDERIINNHLLLFTSALVPKAMASLLTSVILELAKQDDVQSQRRICTDDHLLDAYIKEALRLYPPFFSGRRIVKEEFQAGGYIFPEGYAVMSLTYAIHRDPTTFEEHDSFLPGRWKEGADDNSRLFSFGFGSRSCLGQTLVMDIIKIVIKVLLSECHITLPAGQNLTHKWLPVSRPKDNVEVEIYRHRQA